MNQIVHWQKRMKRAAIVLLVALQFAAATATAQVEKPQPMDQPVASEWRAPIGRFLHELGAPNPETILDQTKGELTGFPSDSMLIRFEYRDLCSQQRCLTAVGTIRTNIFFPDVMVAAGKFRTRSDVIGNLWDKWIPPSIWLCTSDDLNDCLALQETPKGWIVIPTIN